MKRSRSFGDFDVQTLREAFSGPGMDPREWVSYAIVDADGESDEEKSVVFDEDLGPLVNVTLHPAGKQVRCRVASFVAGNGEADWYPFLEKDEVLVVMPEGSERNAIIIARLNQSIDKFPTMVGGADVTKNNVGFRRVRAPYIFEFARSYLLTQVPTGAAFLIDKAGAIYLKDGEGSAMHIGADWIGFTMKDTTDFAMQYQISDKKFNVSVDGGLSQLVLAASDTSTLTTAQSFALATAGNMAYWHAISLESVLVLFQAIGALLAPTPLTPAQIATGIATASAMPLDPAVQRAMMLALTVPAMPPSLPSVACAGFAIG